MTHRCVLVCTPYRYLMLIDENYVEFSISIWRNVPVVNRKLCRFTVVVTWLHQWTDAKDEWGHKASPCCKLKCPFENNLWHCTNILLYIKILTMDWQIKGIRYTIYKNLVSLLSGGGGSLLSGGRYFRGGGGRYFGGPLLSGLTSGHKKIDVNFGGSLLSGGRYYWNFTVCYSPLEEKPAGFLAAKKA